MKMALVIIPVITQIVINVGFWVQDIQSKVPVLYFEYKVKVKDTLFLKSENNWIPLNNSHELLYKCYSMGDLLIYTEYMIVRDVETGQITGFIPKKSKSGDTTQYFYYPKQIYKQGNEFYKTEASILESEKLALLSALNTTFERNDSIPASIVFPPYAWMGGGFDKISDMYLNAKLVKWEKKVFEWDEKYINNLIQQFRSISDNALTIRKNILQTASRAYQARR